MAESRLNMEIFNVIVCLKLMSICCEGKAELAELKCQEKIMDVEIALHLYSSSGKLWQFKAAIIDYVAHVYLDSGSPTLFDASHGEKTLKSLKKIIQLVELDLAVIQEEWHNLE